MAKNSKTGTVVVSARNVIRFDGTVLSVADEGVTIETREFGRQTKNEVFVPTANIIAHSDEGPDGFIVTVDEEVLAVYNGTVEIVKGITSVITEGGRAITVAGSSAASVKIIYDKDGSPVTTLGKEGARRSDRLDRQTAKEAPAKKEKKVKTEKSGKRR